MRMLLTLLVIAYLVGVGVTLAPTIRANWSTVPASEFVEKIVAELPRALSWPVAAYRSVAENPDSHRKPAPPSRRLHFRQGLDQAAAASMALARAPASSSGLNGLRSRCDGWTPSGSSP